MMRVIYVAGPYRALTPWRIQANILKARLAALEIWKLGAVAICPHANTALYDGEAPDDLWLRGDLELLRRSDAIFLLDGWQASTGAVAEWEAASGWKMPRFEAYQMAELKIWIDNYRSPNVVRPPHIGHLDPLVP